MRSLLLFSFVFSVAACAAPVGGEQASAEQAASADATAAPVALRLAVSTVECSGGDCSAGMVQKTHFSVDVQNLAFDKKVAVEVTYPDATSEVLFAHFERASSNGREIWSVDHQYSSFDGNAPRDLTFRVLFGENGNLHVDDHHGRNYGLLQNGWAMLGDQSVLLETASNNPDANESDFVLYVNNLAFNKQLSVVYTTDHWKTKHAATAHYTGTSLEFGGPRVPNPNAYGVERWIAQAPASGNVEFAISYDVNGVTHWDNNFGKNYAMAAGGAVGN